MTVTQYKGPRMVPLVPEPGQREWDKTKSYEYWTLVQYQGASYISVQNVPVGVEITNENYWMLSAEYNSQVEQYRREVLTFDGRINDNTDAIAAIRSNTQFTNKHIVFIGDSYVQGNADPSGTSVIDPVISILGLKNVHVYGNGGAGFVTKGNRAYPNKNYSDMLSDVISSELSSVADLVEYVVFVGGWNDTNQSGIQNAVSSTIAKARSIFKNAKIINLFVNCGSIDNTRLLSHVVVCRYYMLGSKSSGAAFSSCRAIPWWMETPSTDGIHPTTNAINWYIGPWIASALVAGGEIDDFLGGKFIDNDLHFNVDNVLPASYNIDFSLGRQTLLSANYATRAGTAANVLYVAAAGANEWKTVTLNWNDDGSIVLPNKEGFNDTITIYKIAPGLVSALILA